MIARTELARDLVVLACAISAGVHAALTPAHFAEGAAPGTGFLGSAAVLAALVIVLTRRPASTLPVASSALLLAGLLGSYALATTIGVPLLHPDPDPEPVDGLALATKAVEAVGLLAAAQLLLRDRPTLAPTLTRPKGRTT